MAEIISISRNRDKLWEQYVAAQRRAQESGDLTDGIEAGHAWRRWLDLYMTPEQRSFVDGGRGGMIG
jgi:hypothetical protein